MIQCLAEKRADVNYRITVTRQIVRPPRKVDVVLLPKEDSHPHCGVDPKSNNVIPFKITPPKPWFGIGPDWIQFSFCPNANLRTVNQSLYVQLRASMTLATTRRKPCGCG